MKTKRNFAAQTLTVQEAADILGVSPWTIRKLIRTKQIKAVQAVKPIRISEAYFRKLCGLEPMPGSDGKPTDEKR